MPPQSPGPVRHLTLPEYIRVLRHRARGSTIDGACCPRCFYPTRGLHTAQCPECGHDLSSGVIDPSRLYLRISTLILLTWNFVWVVTLVVVFPLYGHKLPPYFLHDHSEYVSLPCWNGCVEVRADFDDAVSWSAPPVVKVKTIHLVYGSGIIYDACNFQLNPVTLAYEYTEPKAAQGIPVRGTLQSSEPIRRWLGGVVPEGYWHVGGEADQLYQMAQAAVSLDTQSYRPTLLAILNGFKHAGYGLKSGTSDRYEVRFWTPIGYVTLGLLLWLTGMLTIVHIRKRL